MRTNKLMQFNRGWRLIIFATACLLTAGKADADAVVFDNFGPGNYFDPSIGGAIYQDFYNGTNTQQASLFAPSSGGSLKEVTLPLFFFQARDGYASDPRARVMLFDDDNGQPGVELIGSDIVVPFFNFSDNSLMLPTTVGFADSLTLTQGSPYWLVVDALGPGSVLSWSYTENYLNTTAIRANRELGDPWTIYYGDGGETVFSVTVATVPVPPALFLFLSGVVPVMVMAFKQSSNA